ncbi:MAG: glycosyltransferase family 39 protein [Candidatus Micrarchaeaceae archaeon]
MGKGQKPSDDVYALIALIAIIAAGLLLAYLFYSGPFVLFDDTAYITYAHQMLNGKFMITGDYFTFSLCVILPLALLFKVLGYSIIAAIIPTISEFVLLVVFVFMAGRELQGNKLAALAALFAATSPIAVLYATRILPDILVGMLVAAAFYALIKAQKKASKGMYLLSGILMGVTPLARSDGFVLIAFYLFAMIVASIMHKKKAKVQMQKYALLGIIVALAAYLAIFFAYTGNPIYGITDFSRVQSVISRSTLASNIHLLFNLLGPAVPIPPNPYTYLIGPVILFSMIGSALALAKRNALSLLAIFNISIFFYYLLGTVSIFSYSPFILDSRYLAVLLMPMSVMAAYLIIEIYENAKHISRPYAFLGAAALVLAVTSLYVQAYAPNYSYNAGIKNETLLYESMLGYINSIQKANTTVYIIGDVPPLQAGYINFLAGYGRISAIPVGTGSICTYSDNSFLAVITLGPSIYVPQNIKSAYDWSNANCKLQLLRNFTIGGHNALLYKVEKG